MKDREIENLISLYLAQLGASLPKLSIEKLAKIANVLDCARQRGKSVYTFGNGGSASTASHFASDLNKGAIHGRKPRLKAYCLSDNIPVMTAWANDVSYDRVFAEQVENFVRKGDVVIAISGSGKSKNVLNAVKLAGKKGATTVGLTGFDGGELKDCVDVAVVVPSDVMEQVEDAHLVIEHIVTTCLREMG